ncbi:hypothetical protein NBE98_20210 [Clostridium swellfunianum]|uniref:hypothetical protein n=1 Tax=Clostridium swellfunianum TaxID=1367462 RepID=UPI00202FF4AF|nr:hypothetical protein [Clostridium swellfunianum]MCM0650690.1 hypothetical protein [Clostridium swellfunianum]
MNIEVANSKNITSAECINCQLCVLACPKEGCRESNQATKALKPYLALTLVISIFIGDILISKSVGIYNTIPEPITVSAVLTADEIRGYMPLIQVSNGLKIDIKELYKRLAFLKMYQKKQSLKK